MIIDACADQIGRDEVGRELDALELAANRFRQGLDRHRLGQTRHALDENVTPRQQRHDQSLQQVILADDDLFHFVQYALHRPSVFGLDKLFHQGSPSIYVLRQNPSQRRLSHRTPDRTITQYSGNPAAGPAMSMRTAKPMPIKKSCSVGFASAVTMPIT